MSEGRGGGARQLVGVGHFFSRTGCAARRRAGLADCCGRSAPTNDAAGDCCIYLVLKVSHGTAMQRRGRIEDMARRGETECHRSRSEERRGGKECVSTCSSRWARTHTKKK